MKKENAEELTPEPMPNVQQTTELQSCQFNNSAESLEPDAQLLHSIERRLSDLSLSLENLIQILEYDTHC